MRYYRIGMQEVRKRNDAIVYIMNNKNFNDIILRSARKVNSWCNDIYFEFDKNNGVFMTDYLANNVGCLLVSEKLKNLIELSECEAQFIKVIVKEKYGEEEYDYYIANILTSVSALNLEHSTYWDSEYNGKVVHHIIKYAINEKNINGNDVFMLSDDIMAGAWFCSDRFKKMYRSEKLTGMQFREIKIL